jgi:hypothetical protein
LCGEISKMSRTKNINSMRWEKAGG